MESPVFRSGLRRLLYPATSHTLPVEEESSEQLAEILKRLDLQPNDCQALPGVQRTFDGRFVDVASGEIVIDQIDLEIPGPVPFQWGRFWRYNQLTAGPLGYGWRHSYDFALLEDRRSRRVVVRLPDNRGLIFPLLAEGEHFLNRKEKLRLSRDEYGYWLQTPERLIYRFALNPSGSICRLSAIEQAGTAYRIRLSYTPVGHLRRISDDFQRVIDVVTDPQGRINRLETTLPDQSLKRLTLVAYHYDEDQNLKEVLVQGQRTAQYNYRQNRLIRLTDAFRQSVFFTYEKSGNEYQCTEVKRESSAVSLHFRYLSAEGRTQVTNGAGGVRQYVHEAGVVQRFISAGGRQRVWFFSEFGELLSEQDALGNTSFFTYDERGNMTQTVWPDGGKMQMQYNDNEQLIALIDRADGAWLWTYDEAGRLLSYSDPVGAETRFTYQEDGLLEEMMQANGLWIQWEYDHYGNRKAQTSATGSWISWEYDSLGQLIIVSQSDKTTVEPLAKTDGHSEVVSLTDSQAIKQFHPTYDADGQLIRLRRTDRLNWQFIRDAAGRVREYTRSDGSSTHFHYDAAGRLTEVLFNDGSWHHYTYRPDGWLIEAATPTTLVQFERDPLGRIVTETSGPTVIQSAYNNVGSRISLQSSAQAVVAYDYDDLGRLNSQQHPQSRILFAYDQLSRPTERQMPGGLRSRWQYSSGPLPTSHQLFWGSSLQAARTQTYGWNGQQLVRLQDARFGTVNIRYDRVNEPIEAIYSTGWTDRWVAERAYYQQQLLKPAPETVERGWQVITVGAIRFYYDAEGYLREKRVAGQVWQFQWHESGTLQRVIRPDNQPITFAYDALGRRIGKTSADHKVEWAWDGKRLLHEWHQTPDSEPVQLTWYTADTAEPTMLQIGKNMYSLVCNYAGQPLSLHNEQGDRVWEWQWCLFGKKRNLTGPAHKHTFLGIGQFEDSEAGLIYDNFRYFDADTGLPISPEYSSPAGWARSGWEPPHAPESYLSAARYIRAY
ncbi:DUF6531 domain-containing protein [Spirosoma flavum]|uniref:DUF6531 domain-containing protein n=1 Tax=Spirosoma flavum TaxID=2048557 RepID=A0ABW6AHK7_9BACT